MGVMLVHMWLLNDCVYSDFLEGLSVAEIIHYYHFCTIELIIICSGMQAAEYGKSIPEMYASTLLGAVAYRIRHCSLDLILPLNAISVENGKP